ncbi:hypothetical protein ACI6Q2_10285 [Chitinophagaceae bacterium LWZ2-11]
MKYLLILIAITIVGCNNSQPRSILVKDTVVKAEREDKHKALLPDTIFLSKKAYSEKDNNTNLLKDQSDDLIDVVYEKIKKEGEVIFFIDKNLFRIKFVPENEIDNIYNSTMILEKKQKDNWIKNIELDKGRGLFFEDVNLDGYKDLMVKDRWGFRVYFYLPTKQRISSDYVYLEETTEILDAEGKIFYSIESTKTVDHESYLFKYENDKPYIFYLLHCIKDPDDPEQEKVKEVKLYKCKNGDYNKRVFLKKLYPTHDFTSFDSVPFWRKNWKRLIKEY